MVRLVGLIARNGILVVQFANLEQARDLSKVAAVQAAAETGLHLTRDEAGRVYRERVVMRRRRRSIKSELV